MKRFYFILCILFSYTSWAQTCGILLFTENGEKFKVFTNGTQRNEKFVSEIKICGFPTDIVKLKLEFEDHSLCEKSMFLRMGIIEHYRITKTKEGKWRISFDSDEEIPSQYYNLNTVKVITINLQNGATSAKNNVSNVKITTKTNSCMTPISDRSFYELYGRLKNLSFDSDKIKDAKGAVSRDCFSSKQIKNLLATFTHESSRLEFAKYAYDFVFDKGAYAIVKDGFSNSLSGDELDSYLSKK